MQGAGVGNSGARYLVLATFLAGGTGIGTWGANLPAMARRAGLSEGQIGIVLLCFAVGAILAMTRMAGPMERFGVGRVALTSAIGFGGGVALVGLIGGLVPALAVALVCGVTFGTLDVAMNKAATMLEARAGRPVLAGFHAMFSAGTLIGAAGYAQLVLAGLPPAACLAIPGVAVATIAAIGGRMSRGADWSETPSPAEALTETIAGSLAGTRLAAPGSRVLILGAMAALAFLVEGAIMDWGGIYLVRVMGTAETTGALGYACFAGMMTLGRLLGDRANRTLGAAVLFRLSTLTVAVALAIAMLVPSVPLILVALGICGFGIANVVPLIFSATGRIGGADGGRAMSRVLSMGYGAILVGPACIGLVAEAVSLRASLLFVAAAMGAVALCARFLVTGTAVQPTGARPAPQ